MIMTKIGMPVPRDHYVVRTRLFSKLEQIRYSKAALIEGGAGTGKTTLVSSWFQQSGSGPVFWITLDEAFDHVIVFWNYVMEALKDLIGNDIQMQTVLKEHIQEEDMEQVLALLINRLYEAGECFLVLDNVQYIKNQKLLESLDFFVAHMPDRMHLILSGRKIPNIYLGTLAMEAKLFEIRPEELKLDQAEAAAFLKNTLQLSCKETTLSEMCRLAAGWVGGLQLLSLSVTKDGENIRKQKFSGSIIDKYMEREVLSSLTSKEIEFLTVAGILGYFDEEVCGSLFEDFSFHQMIQGLLGKNVMLTILNEEKEIYCCHDILKEFFGRRFETLPESQKGKILRKASEVYLEKGDFGECLKYDIKRRDYTHAMQVIAQMEFAGEAITYLKQIPIERSAECPEFACQAFFYYYSNFEEETCEKIYRLIEEKMKYDQVYEAFSYIDLFLARSIQKRHNEILPLEETLNLPMGKMTMTITLIKNAYLLFIQDRVREAEAYLREADQYYQESANLYIGFFLYTTKCQMYEYTGKLSKAMEAYEASRPLIARLPNMKPSFFVGIAGVYIKQMELEKAGEALCQTKNYMQEKSGSILLAWKVTSLRLLVITGQYEEAREMLADIRNYPAAKLVHMGEELLLYYKAMPGDPVFEEFQKDYESTDLKETDYNSQILYALLLWEKGKEKEALELLESILAYARETGNKAAISQAGLMKARLLLHKEDKESIRIREAAMSEAVYYSFSENHRLPFWMVRDQWGQLLQKAGPLWKKQLSAKEQDFIRSLGTAGQNELLTLREREVLMEIKKGKTNKEIARDLCISLATVKSHLIHIYSKLGASNRLDAVNKMEDYDYL